MSERDTIPGFTYYGSAFNTRILLPDATVAVLDKESELAKIRAAEEKANIELVKSKEEAVKLSAIQSKMKISKPGKRDVEVFSRRALKDICENFESMENSAQRAGLREHAHFTENSCGFRTLPSVKPRAVLALENEFENMREPIRHLAGELELMLRLPIHDFNITPMLLLGEPGIGKTAFALALSNVMSVPFKKLNGSEPSFNLTGSHPTWGKAAPGLMFKQMALHGCAAPLFLVDEVDKPGGDRYPISLALLDLLERKNAENFTDEYFQVSFDASYAMWILTANTTAGIAEPLLSRVMTFNIPTPGVEQRQRIIKTEFGNLCKRVGAKVKIASSDVSQLAERADLDLRKINRIVRDSVIEALGRRSSTATFTLPPAVTRSMGFI